MNTVISTFSNITDDVDTIADICYHIQFHLTNDAPEGHYHSVSIVNLDNDEPAIIDAFDDSENIEKNFSNIISALIAMKVRFEILLTMLELDNN